MSKLKAILVYLFYQSRYELMIFWAINAIFIVFFTVIASLYPDKINFTIFPSGPIYILVAIQGAKWINRTLSYLLRLGINRQQYAIGSVAFIIFYNIINSLIILLFFGLYKLLHYFEPNSPIEYLHPSLLFNSEPNVWLTFFSDFLLFTFVMLVFMLMSIALHRLGKLGSYIIFAAIGAILIISTSLGWLNPLANFLIESNYTAIMFIMSIVLLVLASLFAISLRNVSINCKLK